MNGDNLFSQKVLTLRPSPTIALTTKAQALKAEGKDVIVLGAGEPDFDTPQNIKDFAIEAIQKGKTKYTPVAGTNALRSAVVAKFKRENNIEYKTSEVIVGTGAKQVLFNAMMASINQGDEVIIPAPYWVSYPDIVGMFGGISVFIKTKKQNLFKATAEEIEQKITPKTKWVILNSPSNPSGEVYTKQEMLAIAEVVKKHKHVYVLCDDIYEHVIYNNEFCTMAQVAPELADRVFTLNGVSKSYAMTGWRIGYGAIKNERFIKMLENIQSQSTSNPSSISQEAALEALNGDQSFIKKNQEIFKKRRDIVVNGINSIPGLWTSNPAGAFYIFFSIEAIIGKKTPTGDVIKSCSDFSSYMLDKYLVAGVPGVAFGYENYIRISYATSESELQKGVERIKLAVESLS
jgi:aspartate aminotransferase